MLNNFYKLLFENNKIAIVNRYDVKDVVAKIKINFNLDSPSEIFSNLDRKYDGKNLIDLLKRDIIINHEENLIVNEFIKTIDNIEDNRQHPYLVKMAYQFLLNTKFVEINSDTKNSIFYNWNINNNYIDEERLKKHLLIYYSDFNELHKFRDIQFNKYNTLCFFRRDKQGNYKNIGPFYDLKYGFDFDNFIMQLKRKKRKMEFINANKIDESKKLSYYNEYLKACIDYQSNYLINNSIIVERYIDIYNKQIKVSQSIYPY